MTKEEFIAVVKRYLTIGEYFAVLTPNKADDWVTQILRGLVDNTEILDLIYDQFLKGMTAPQVVGAVYTAMRPVEPQPS